jgi:hypothetical protein
MLAHADGELLLILVEQDDVLAAPGKDLGPGSHGNSKRGESQFS